MQVHLQHVVSLLRKVLAVKTLDTTLCEMHCLVDEMFYVVFLLKK